MALGRKISLLAVFLLSLVCLVGGFGLYESDVLGRDIGRLVESELPKIRELVLIDMVHDGTRGVALSAQLGALTGNHELIQQAGDDLKDHRQSVKESYDHIERLELSESLRKEVGQTREKMKAYQEAAADLISHAESGDLKLVAASQAKIQTMFEELEKLLSLQADHAELENQAFLKQVDDDRRSGNRFSYALMFFGLFLGIFVAISIRRSSQAALLSINDRISASARSMSEAVTQLAGASQELASSTTQQSSSLQQTAASIDEISSMVRQNAENATQSVDLSDRSRSEALAGSEVIRRMIDSIAQISRGNEGVNREVQDSSQKFSEIVKVIHEIGAKTKVINEIVFQTKLLSFNASVEAVRAGEHGKGFAVVAEEVGNLAAMSGNAAHDISGLLAESIQRVESIVSASNTNVAKRIEESESAVKRGAEVANECGDVLTRIVSGTSEVSQLIGGISTAGREQAHGVTEISKAIHQLNQTTKINAAAADKCSWISSSLRDLVAELNEASQRTQMLTLGRTNAGHATSTLRESAGGPHDFEARVESTVGFRKAA